jgi:hypothetical protein
MIKSHYALFVGKERVVGAQAASSAQRLIRLSMVREHDMFHPHEEKWKMRPSIVGFSIQREDIREINPTRYMIEHSTSKQ